MARARSSGRNDACRMARLPGVNSAPPTPWSTRAPMRSAALGARPQRAEATANHTTPMEKTRLPPEAVAEGPAQEQEGRQGQCVPGDHPLQGVDATVEVAADGGERDADDRRIEHGDARAEHRGRDDPAAPPAREGKGLGRQPRVAPVGVGSLASPPLLDRGAAVRARVVRETVAPVRSTAPSLFVDRPGAGGATRARHFKMLTARATTRIPTTREMADSAIIMSFAQVLTADTSVGLKAAAVANAKWK